MKKFFFALMVMCGLAYGQTTPPIIERQFYDDTYVHVPLQFGFPFYGRTFTNSWMHSNGIVSFLDPAVPVPNAGYNPGQWAYCCEGVPPSTTRPEFSYMIAPLWTDLYPVGQSRFRTQGDATFQRYYWENIAEISNMSNLNTFGLEIRPSGYIGALYQNINIQNQNTWVGTIGDPTLGQWNQIYYGRGIPQGAVQNWSMNDTGPVDMCIANPLSSPTCAGYTEAMCAANPLYSSSCAGYQQAYFNQQCSANPLYNVNCPGYATAYLSYQCSVDPLYSTTCAGYETAYFNQQCTANPLYNRNCAGYDTAYFNQQCSLNPLYSTQCQGYETAYFNQQCSISPLYSRTCPGYETAYFTQQCTANPLYSTQCSGYQQAYFNQQCTANGLYSTQCPNYAEAYATKMALESVQPTTTTTTTVTAPQPTTTTPTVESSGEIKVAVVADQNVNNVITTTATSASPAQAATATVPLVAPAPAPAPVAAVVEAKVEAKQENKTEEKKDASSSSVSSTSTASNSSSTDSKPAAPTARQELQARREAAAKAKAVEDGKNLAGNMGKVADMESQKQVQNVVIAAMGYTPGFDVYGSVFIPQTVGYRPYTVYNNQVNVDNRRTGRLLFGATDRLHSEMVDAQYNR